MTEDETKAVVRTVIRTETRVKRLEALVWIVLAIVVGVALREYIG